MVLSQVDIEDTKCTSGQQFKQRVQRCGTLFSALGERPEAECGSRLCCINGRWSEGDVIPGDALADVIFRDATVIKGDRHGSRWMVTGRNAGCFKTGLPQEMKGIPAEVIVSDTANRKRGEALFHDLVTKIGWCTTKLAASREHVPEELSKSDYRWLHVYTSRRQPIPETGLDASFCKSR